MVFPRPNRPQFERATSRDPLSSRDPLPLALPKEVQKGGEGSRPEGGVPARRGVGVPARGILRPIRCQAAWEYHEPGPPNEPGPLAQFILLLATQFPLRKILAPIKIKSALPPPPKPPPKNAEFYGHGFSCRKNAFFPGVHKSGAAISGPRIADTNFTDTRIFLTLVKQ